jgi:hypothetical protein
MMSKHLELKKRLLELKVVMKFQPHPRKQTRWVESIHPYRM